MPISITIGPWLPAAAEAVANLGFTLLDSDHPASPAGSRLVVALRARPTLRHFDPELITCWIAAAGRGRPLTVDRSSKPGERAIAWGHVHVVDRLGVQNRFLTFGGTLRSADVDPGLRVVEHASPGPVVRWGGHSQGSDPLAGEIGAFFGRLIVPVDCLPGAEARLAAEPPASLYAAFLRDGSTRRARGAHRTLESDADSAFWSWLQAEVARVQGRDPGAWQAGEALLRDLGLAGA
ncbi:MAG: hypothetical protein HY264_00635 [Chloroflexi bacterium]|nr:hypothetical protein [Chloroflexota bacterium]